MAQDAVERDDEDLYAECRAPKGAGRKRRMRWEKQACTCWTCRGDLRDERTVALHAKRARYQQLDSPLLHDVEDELPSEVLTQELYTYCCFVHELCTDIVGQSFF